jgi:uracil-DNA glycosylase family 4
MKANYNVLAGVKTCTNCRLFRLRESRGALPAWVGRDYAPGGLAVVLEVPGRSEGSGGAPLTGAPGAIFNRALDESGLTRDVLMITHSVRCRPPRNRLGDFPDSIQACSHWTAEELSTYRPSVLLRMGATPVRIGFGQSATAGRYRGTATRGDVFSPISLATYHPAYALPYRSPASFPLIVEDLKCAKELQTWCQQNLPLTSQVSK